LEIYCENIRDLLNPKKTAVYVDLKSSGNKVSCVGQTWISIKNAREFLDQIEVSQSKRIFKNNGVNERSSRSHHVFQIKILSKNKLGRPHESLLNIVDLAGSEGKYIGRVPLPVQKESMKIKGTLLNTPSPIKK
jgi:hypothetical protein